MSLAVGLLASLLSWQIPPMDPGPGLDPSWMAGLSLAARDGLLHGRDVIFTHGPLGPFLYPKLFFGVTALAATATSFFVHTGLTTAIVLLGRRTLSLWLAGAMAFVGGVVGSWLAASQLAAVLVTSLCVAALLTPVDSRRHVLLGMASASSGVLLLMKFNDGVAAATVAGTTAVFLAIGSRDLKPVAWMALPFVGAVVGVWLLTGQSLELLPLFIRGSLELSTGFSSAMGIEVVEQGWEYPSALLIFALLLLALVQATLPLDRWRRLALVCVVTALVFFAYKHGFVRHDAHSAGFFAILCVLSLGIVAASRHKTSATVLLSYSLVAFVWSSGAVPSRMDARANLEASVQRIAQLLSADQRHAAIEGARGRMRATYGLSAEIQEALRGRTVHVDPWEAGVAWAHDGEFEWRPLPVFQSYSAYTTTLDEMNAEFLADDARAPERILRAPLGSIDGRNPTWDAPEATLEMVCRYVEIEAETTWQVLGRSADRCGAPRSIATVESAFGEPIAIPTARADEIVFARVRWDADPMSLVRVFLYKAPTYLADLDAVTVKFVPGTASGPLLVRVPSVLQYASGYGPLAVEANTLTLHRDDIADGEGHFLVEFYAVPVR